LGDDDLKEVDPKKMEENTIIGPFPITITAKTIACDGMIEGAFGSSHIYGKCNGNLSMVRIICVMIPHWFLRQSCYAQAQSGMRMI
jgi:hypothetical protein